MLMHQSLSAPVRVVGMAVAIAAASLLASVASAKGDAVSAVVAYSDLDLTQSADATRLYSRLRYASQKVCASYASRELRMQRLYAACMDDALSAAVERVNDAKLSRCTRRSREFELARRT